ncbi:MAG: isoamylase early set domain-containing protein [Candidatus Omnitrophota bacterium]
MKSSSRRSSMATLKMPTVKIKKESESGKKIIFSLRVSGAKEVFLAGDFNEWNTKSTSLKKDKDNVWRKELFLKPGRYEYKFIVDGNWITDPTNSNRSWNSIGSENSVKEI